MIKRLKTGKQYIFIEGLFLLCWSAFAYSFLSVYRDASDFVTENAKIEIQLLEMFNYRGKELMVVIILFFIIATLNILLIVTLRFEERGKQQSKMSIHVKGLCVTTLILISLFIVNKLWMIMLLVTVFSFVINYIIYSVVDNIITYEDQDLFENRGPFKNEKEAISYAEEVLRKKSDYFKKRQFNLLYMIHNLDNQYFIEMYIEKN